MKRPTKTAIVTGATSGMGSEMIKHVISRGEGYDEIWILGRREERLAAWQEAYPDIRFRTFVLDLASAGERDKFGALLREEKPQISLFVHAAGFGIMGMIDEISVEDQEEMTEVDVTACVSLTSYVLPFMKEGGQMIYFASAAAFLPQPGFAVYAACKAFVLSYVRALRAENRNRKLKITAVCPGAVKTEFLDRATGNRALPAYKQLVLARPSSVVRKAWKDNRRNREISVYGLPMKLFFLATKILPHRCFLTFLGRRRND